jgi:hypothetical protein
MLSLQMDIYKSAAAIDQDSEKKQDFSANFYDFYFFLATSSLLFSATNRDNFNLLKSESSSDSSETKFSARRTVWALLVVFCFADDFFFKKIGFKIEKS